MKFPSCLSALWLLLLVVDFQLCSAYSPLACAYTTLDGNVKALRYYPDIKEGQVYIDYGANASGICVQRATCLETFEYKIDKCEDVDVNCAEVNAADAADFPACCVKC